MLKKMIFTLTVVLLCSLNGYTQKNTEISASIFADPSKEYRPWTFWYWVKGAVSKQGITADLEAMRDVGLDGAYLMFIKDTMGAIYEGPSQQLTEEWFDKVRFAFQEAKRCGIKLGLHISDGFALAGGPWIKPVQSMQQIVWSKLYISGGKKHIIQLPEPPKKENFYRDIQVFAIKHSFPVYTSEQCIPEVTSSHYAHPDFLINGNTETFRADTSAWIVYRFDSIFTARTIIIKPAGNNYQSHRLKILSSINGNDYTLIREIIPARHGWQDGVATVSYAIPETKARYFRFEWMREGSEPASEELDNAKWRAGLKLKGLTISSEPITDQFESKTGQVWRVAAHTHTSLPINTIVNVTAYVKNGLLRWTAPKGEWIILRIGHSSTGTKNETGGAAKGLECDKFSESAIRLQLNNWFDQIVQKVGKDLTKEVLDVMHVDSWECGSQNWSDQFAAAFKKRRGYDMMPYLPIMAGVPMKSTAFTEQFLYDVRLTIADLVNDVCFKTISTMAKERGLKLSAESVAPTMVSDGLRHHQYTDYPMGEFWLNSPTHDKPNDMLDAISGAHIYHKNIVQSESFTQLRMTWNEHPAMLKAIGDRNFAIGINKIVFHVFTHNPWMDKKPGYTLDGVGLYFQRDQTWFNQAKAWVDYIARCQYVLQQGKPVVDLAVFNGDEIPSRSVLPYKLTGLVPGLIGKHRMDAYLWRKENKGYPGREIPIGVKSNANMEDPSYWVNPLQGYQYDCLNADVLHQEPPYSVLLLPNNPLNPTNRLSAASNASIRSLVKKGIHLIADSSYQRKLNLVSDRVHYGVWKRSDLQSLGLTRDVDILTPEVLPESIAFTHRQSGDNHYYFISNQHQEFLNVTLSFRVKGLKPELWDPLTGTVNKNISYTLKDDRTILSLPLEANGSVFVVFSAKTDLKQHVVPSVLPTRKEVLFSKKWLLTIDNQVLTLDSLSYWSALTSSGLNYFSGTATYQNRFVMEQVDGKMVLHLPNPQVMATVNLNGKTVGTIWTPPYALDVTDYIQKGENTISIKVSNTWYNRILFDQQHKDQQQTFTTSPIIVNGKEPVVSGLSGKIYIDITLNK